MMILGLAKNSLSAQYPITKVIRKDTVVIMLKSQADEINRVFTAQREKIQQTTQTTIVLNTNIDSLYNWLSVAAKYNGLLFYHPTDSTLQIVDLRYHTWYIKRNGSIHLKSVPYRNRLQWEQDWRDNPEEMYMPTPFNLFDNIRKKYILNIQVVPKL
jgi:hypothetical protein